MCTAALNPRPPMLTGSFDCCQVWSPTGALNMQIKASLVTWSNCWSRAAWLDVWIEKCSALKNIHPWKIFTHEKYSPVKDIYTWKYSPLKYIHLWEIFTPEKYSPLKNIHLWEMFTPEKYSLLEHIHPSKNIHTWKNLPWKNIQYSYIFSDFSGCILVLLLM